MQPFKNLLHRLKNMARRLNVRAMLRRAWHHPDLLGGRYTITDHTQVYLYSDRAELFPGYAPRRSLAPVRDKRSLQVTFIATARNEAAAAARLFESLWQQTRLPDQIVITDTGSQDETLDRLRELAASSPVPVVILSQPGANIAAGRNAAIQQAAHPIIAVSDFGVTLPETWLQDLVAPFEDDPLIEVSAGRYQAVDADGRPTHWQLGRSLEQIDPQNHLPSGVSTAFQRRAWEAVGGYPEWLTLTGEDTYFALELKRTTRRWAFVPSAAVLWTAPATTAETLRKSYRWAVGDGEAGTSASAYRWAASRLALLAVGLVAVLALVALALIFPSPALRATVLLLLALGLGYTVIRWRQRGVALRQDVLLLALYGAQVLGFWRGLRRRPSVDLLRQEQVRGIFFILAGVPIDDTGGGARFTQIALEMLRRQNQVIYINKFPKYESVELNLDIRHPNLHTVQLDSLDWDSLAHKFRIALSTKPVYGLVELPLSEFEPLIDKIRARQGIVIYDLLDEWDSALGGGWYTSAAEERIIGKSQLLIATAPRLVKRLEEKSQRPVALIPNAVNSYLFNPERSYPRPADFPAAEWTMIYVGALWGEWFDWELLEDLARHYPQAALILIGDTMGRQFSLPENIHMLGLKPQRALPAYLQHAQLAILPWQVSPITQATSPLKVYEFIAMHIPVLAPAIEPLQGLPGVTLAADRREFLQLASELQSTRLPIAAQNQFIHANDWQARLDQLLALTDLYQRV